MSIEEIMRRAVDRARDAGCNVIGGYVADHAVVPTDDGWVPNPDTGSGSEPGFAWIGAWHGREKRFLWKISEAQVADWGDDDGQLADKIVRLCSVLDGVRE